MIVKIPGINGGGKTDGCEKAPNEILKFLKEISFSESGKKIDFQFLDLEEIHLDNSDVKYSNSLIYKNSKEIFEEYPKTIFIGGDSSITYSTGRAFLDYCREEEKEPCLIVFGSSLNLMPPKEEPRSDEWLRKLIEKGFPLKNILLVGVRNFSDKEVEFLNKNKITLIRMNSLLSNLEDICDSIMEFSNNKELYVSMNISIIDPAFAPGVGRREPGGLSSREFIYLISRINKIKRLRALDLVSINPKKDEKNITVKLGAKILAEII
jgi:arginase family enzyme